MAPIVVKKLAPYADERGNAITISDEVAPDCRITFKGSNNRLTIGPGARISNLRITFNGDNGAVHIGGKGKKRAPLHLNLRVGYESSIRFGTGVGTAGPLFVSAVEGARVELGDDGMLARDIEIRCDDSHPIYDVATRRRVNDSRDIIIHPHVWIAKNAVIMGGVTIGQGSVIGFRSIVTKSLPNNCVAVGSPARVVRRNIAWERRLVTDRKPNEVHPRPGEISSDRYWARTVDSGQDESVVISSRSRDRVAGRFTRAARRAARLPMLREQRVRQQLAPVARRLETVLRGRS